MSKKSRYDAVLTVPEKSLKTAFICNMTNHVLILNAAASGI